MTRPWPRMCYISFALGNKRRWSNFRLRKRWLADPKEECRILLTTGKHCQLCHQARWLLAFALCTEHQVTVGVGLKLVHKEGATVEHSGRLLPVAALSVPMSTRTCVHRTTHRRQVGALQVKPHGGRRPTVFNLQRKRYSNILIKWFHVRGRLQKNCE